MDDLIRLKIFSVVIPVFNSETIVAETVKHTREFFNENNLKYEIILVNDGSYDSSWKVISNLGKQYKEVKAINLLRNYGQHNANLCGFNAAKGDYIVTMDDDLQNPPGEIMKLINALTEDRDLVIGRFKEKKHSLFRRLGSTVIGRINRNIFHGDKGLVLTNFRLIRRDVIDRVCQYKSSVPYIPGLVLMFSGNRCNVYVDHRPRYAGTSNYDLKRIAKLVSTILFNYSSLPLRLMAGFGFIVAVVSFILSFYYFLSAIIYGTQLPGWATLVVLLSFFNGVLILIVSVVGEYVIRLLREGSSNASYYIRDVVE